jgi:dolichol kinase
MALICIFIWKDQPWGLVIIMTVAWGDGIAPIAGRYFGKHKYRSLGGVEKTLEGSLGMFFASIFFSYLVVFIFGIVQGENWLFGQTWPWLWGKIIILVLIGTIVEGLSPTDIDNLMVPLAMIIAASAFNLQLLHPLY